MQIATCKGFNLPKYNKVFVINELSIKAHPVSHSSTDDQDKKKGGGGSRIRGLKFPYVVFLETEKENFCKERRSLKPTHNDVSVC